MVIPKLRGVYPRHVIVVHLPMVPRELTGNGVTRTHPMKVSSLSAKAFDDGKRAMRAALGRYDPPRWTDVIAFPILVFRGKQRHDDDNYQFGLKHYRDGMADLLGIDDFHWRWERTAITEDQFNQPKIIVIVADAMTPMIVPEHEQWLKGTQRGDLTTEQMISVVTNAYVRVARPRGDALDVRRIGEDL